MTTLPQIPSAELFCLPPGYRQQESLDTHDEFNTEPYWNAERIDASGFYQHHVYRWATKLILRNNLTSVLDIGCGPGTKLARLIRPICQDTLGVDLETTITVARELHPDLLFEPIDLDHPGALGDRAFDLIICADVIEHLADARVLLENIRSACHTDSRVLLSTPDRDRTRGRSCMESTKKEHVREWTLSEFSVFLSQEQFKIHQTRLLPFGDAGVLPATLLDVPFRLRLADRSPLRCQCVLCSPIDLHPT
jgi:SAM-dependent methyltransferase